MTIKKLGSIRMNAEGLRQMANSLEVIYGEKVVINLPIWEDYSKNVFFQLEKDSGQISCVK